MKRLALIYLSLWLAQVCSAQTPSIMHKRMGGTQENFNQTMADPEALIRQSNFGLPPTIHVKRAIIDSIIVLDDITVVVVTSHKLVEEFHWSDYEWSAIDSSFVCSDSMLARSLEYDSTGTWKPGRDTLVNHALFSPRNTCNQILMSLRDEYQIYSRSTMNIVFIGFDCTPQQNRNQRNMLPVIWNIFPKDPNTLILIISIFSILYFLYLRRISEIKDTSEIEFAS